MMKLYILSHKPVTGATLIELIVAVGIITGVFTAVLIAVNPARQFAQSRNAQRSSDTNALFKAISQYAATRDGAVPPGIDLLPKTICDGQSATCTSETVDLSILVPTFLSVLPKDPSGGASADTKYKVYLNDENRPIVIASAAELDECIVIGEDCSPKHIDGLRVWLKTESITAENNQSVGSWRDKSGYENTATQAVTGEQPRFMANAINGSPALRFDGNDRLLIVNNPSVQFTGSVSVFIAYNLSQQGNLQYLLTKSSTGEFWSYISSTAPYAMFGRHGNGSSWWFGTLRAGTSFGWQVLTIIRSVEDGGYYSYVNGADLFDGRNGSALSIGPSTNPLTIGGSTSGGNYGLRGDIAEVIIYNRELTEVERKRVESYLLQKYGL